MEGSSSLTSRGNTIVSRMRRALFAPVQDSLAGLVVSNDSSGTSKSCTGSTGTASAAAGGGGGVLAGACVTVRQDSASFLGKGSGSGGGGRGDSLLSLSENRPVMTNADGKETAPKERMGKRGIRKQKHQQQQMGAENIPPPPPPPPPPFTSLMSAAAAGASSLDTDNSNANARQQKASLRGDTGRVGLSHGTRGRGTSSTGDGAAGGSSLGALGSLGLNTRRNTTSIAAATDDSFYYCHQYKSTA